MKRQHPGTNGAPAGAPHEIPTAPAGGVRTFGVWLDDATLAAPRSIWITAGVTRWSAPSADGVDVPSLAVAAGLTPRAQLSFSIAHSRASIADTGEEISDLGNIYAGLKLLLRDPATHAVGVSVSPSLEILSPSSVVEGDSRVNVVAPLSIEAGHRSSRVYGSMGVFSRGAVFASAAFEQHLTERTSLTAALMQSWATSDAEEAATLGLRRSRTDAGGGITVFLAPEAAIFAFLSRTISPMEFDGSRYVVSAGLAIGFAAPRRPLPRPPR